MQDVFFLKMVAWFLLNFVRGKPNICLQIDDRSNKLKPVQIIVTEKIIVQRIVKERMQ